MDLDRLADLLTELGASSDLAEAARAANTANQVLAMAQDESLALANAVASDARRTALATLAGETEVEVLIFDREARLVGRANA